MQLSTNVLNVMETRPAVFARLRSKQKHKVSHNI